MPLFRHDALGLDVSDRSAEAVLLRRSGAGFALVSYGRIAMPPGAVVDGFVEDPEAARRALRALLTERMRPPLPKGALRAAVALPQSQVYGHVFRVPSAADASALGPALDREADAHLPYPHAETASAHAVVARTADRLEVAYAAVHRKTLGGFLALLRSAGVEPVVAEGESAATARAAALAGFHAPFLTVDIGARVTDVAFVDAGGVRFTETLATAGDAFASAVAEAAGLPADEAETLKREEGLQASDVRVRSALGKAVDQLADGIASALAAAQEASGHAVSAVALCGGSALMPGLEGRLRERLHADGHDIDVELVDPWYGLEIDEELEALGIRDRGVLATTAVGSALRAAGMRSPGDLDFLPSARAASDDVGTEGMRIPVLRAVHHPFAAWPVWLRLGAAVVAVLAVALGAWLVAFRPQGPRPVVTLPLPDAVPLEMSAAVAAEVDLLSHALPLEPIAFSFDIEKEFAREAMPTEGYATGRIEIVNGSAAAQTLIERTRFVSDGGVLFRLVARTVVPARGSVLADVVADVPGAAGDIGPSGFTLPGLPASLRSVVTGRSDAAMRGGLVDVAAPFTAEERDAALRELSELAVAQAPQELARASDDGRIVLKETLAIGEPDVAGWPNVGDAPATYRVTAAYRAEASAVRAADVRALLMSDLKRSVQPGADLSAHDIEGITAVAVKGEDGSVVGLRLMGTAVRKR